LKIIEKNLKYSDISQVRGELELDLDLFAVGEEVGEE